MSSETLQDVIADEYTRNCVTVDEFSLDDEFVRVPSDLAYWGQKYADTLRTFYLSGLDIDQCEAELSVIERERLTEEDSKNKAPTETAVKLAVRANPRWVDAKKAEIEAIVEKTRVRGMVDAIEMKSRVIQSLGAKQRIEMMADPSMRKIRTEESDARRGSSGGGDF